MHSVGQVNGKPKFKYSVSSLTARTIPGLSSHMKLDSTKYVEYIPDFCHALTLAQKEFRLFQNVPEIKDVDDITITTFTIHLAYQLFYYYLVVTNAINPQDYYGSIIQIFRRAGFNKLMLHRNLSDWVVGLGEFKDNVTNDVYVPKFPDFTADTTTGFATDDTKHLLPNFRLMLSFLWFLNAGSCFRPYSINFVDFINNIHRLPRDHGVSPEVRAAARRLNYFENILSDRPTRARFVRSYELPFERLHSVPILDYLCFDERFLSNLHQKMEIYYSVVDHIEIDSISSNGSDLCLARLHVLNTMTIASENNIPYSENVIQENPVREELQVQSDYEMTKDKVHICAQTPLITIRRNDLFTGANIEPFDYAKFNHYKYKTMKFCSIMFHPNRIVA